MTAPPTRAFAARDGGVVHLAGLAHDRPSQPASRISPNVTGAIEGLEHSADHPRRPQAAVATQGSPRPIHSDPATPNPAKALHRRPEDLLTDPGAHPQRERTEGRRSRHLVLLLSSTNLSNRLGRRRRRRRRVGPLRASSRWRRGAGGSAERAVVQKRVWPWLTSAWFPEPARDWPGPDTRPTSSQRGSLSGRF